MGPESITTYFRPRTEGGDELVRGLLEVGACESNSKFPSFRTWVLSSPEYWINFLLFEKPESGATELSIRVAVCNPNQAQVELRRVMDQLKSTLGG